MDDRAPRDEPPPRRPDAAELASRRSIALLRATLDAATDGLLALDARGRLATVNRRFLELWRVPGTMAIEPGEEEALLRHMAAQLRNPEALTSRFERSLFREPVETFDVLELVDGRVFEACSRPQWYRESLAGRVWSFRDATAHAVAERELRDRSRRIGIQNQILFQLARHRVSDPMDLDALLRRVTESAAALMETERAGIWLFEDGRSRIRLRELHERSTGRHSSGDVIDAASAPSYLAALERERALAVHDVHTDPRTDELADTYCAPLGISSMLDAPIRTGGEVIGVVCFEQVGPPRTWTVEEASFAGSIADIVSIAMETTDRQRAERRVELLAEASAVLASSQDYHATVSRVARMAVPTIADWCTVDVLDDGGIRRIAAAHADASRIDLLRTLEREYPARRDSEQPSSRAIRTGEVEFVEHATPEILRGRVDDDRHLEIVLELGVVSYIAAPLTARDRTLGAMTLVSARRPFTTEDVAMARDLAARVAAAVDQAIRYREAEEANRAKSNFLAVMSHELRTPLTAIMGYADLLASEVSGTLNAEQREQIKRIHLRAEDLLRIVEEILAFSKSEAGTETPRIERVELRRFIRDVEEAARPLVEERGLLFRVELPEEPSPIRTDPTRLRHILLNLLANAAKFTDRGSVTLRAGVHGGRLRISVEDTGRGIAPADQERIFEPFIQAEEATTREKGGTGLGLTVGRRLARLLGGDITVESELGRGSTFTVDLPAEPAARPGPNGARRAARRPPAD